MIYFLNMQYAQMVNDYKTYIAYNITHYIFFKDHQKGYLSRFTLSSKKPDGTFDTAWKSSLDEPVPQVYFTFHVTTGTSVANFLLLHNTDPQYSTTFPHFALLFKDGQALLKVSLRPLIFFLTVSLGTPRFFLLPHPRATVLF